MDDLISRISLKQSIAVSAILKDKKTLDQIIDEEPTIDAVPVVRCRDCKHYAGEGMYCSQDICVMFDHFYCYYAERKES